MEKAPVSPSDIVETKESITFADLSRGLGSVLAETKRMTGTTERDGIRTWLETANDHDKKASQVLDNKLRGIVKRVEQKYGIEIGTIYNFRVEAKSIVLTTLAGLGATEENPVHGSIQEIITIDDHMNAMLETKMVSLKPLKAKN